MNIFGGGWGGRPTGDGESSAVSICQGDVRNVPIEVQETNFPFIVDEFGLRPDSGGTGKHRGGLGAIITYRCLQKTLANINLERIVDPPWGILGGGIGQPNVAIIRRTDGSEERATKETNIQLEEGDRVTFLTAGGGGFGDPNDRDRAAIENDLREGLITPQAAARDYGYTQASEAAE
jgi:N-methylhydantoinase B